MSDAKPMQVQIPAGGEKITIANGKLHVPDQAIIPYIEGDGIFLNPVDVVVCDGFVGNVALKTSEGLASMLSKFVKQEFTRSIFTKLAALVALPVLRRLQKRVDHRRYNGAALLGLRGLVFKSHGSADAFAFEQALNRAYDAARNGLLDRVHDRILETLAAMPAVAVSAQPGIPPAPDVARIA